MALKSSKRAGWLATVLLTASTLLAACDSGGSPTTGPSGAADTPTTGAAAVATTAPTTAAGAATTAPTTAAGGAADTPTTAAGGAASTPTEAMAATTPATSGGTGAGTTTGGAALNTSVSGTVNLWHFWGSPVRRTAIRRIVALCGSKLPNIKISETFKPFGDIWTANTAAVAAGSGMADVIVEDRPKLPQTAANKVDMSLQKYIDRDKFDSSVYWPFTWQQTLYNNESYGIPYETDVRVLYWDKNAFKEVGLDPEKPPTTWDELQQYADKLDKKNPDGTFSRIAFSPLAGNTGWDLWSKTDGQQLVSADGTKVTVNDPKMVETFTWMKTWIDRYGGWANYQKFVGAFTSPPNDAFMSGKVAMIVDINGYASQLKFYNPQVAGPDGKKATLDWGVALPPYKTTPTSTSGGFALSIPNGTKNADAAWEVIKCATGPEAQASWARDTYAMPANMSAAKDPVLLADPAWQFMVDAMGKSQPLGGPFVKSYANFGEQVDKRQADIWSGKTDVKTALDDAQKAIDETMAKNP
jgi:multiple sugar transport system substrate-binding protein